MVEVMMSKREDKVMGRKVTGTTRKNGRGRKTLLTSG